MCEEADSREWWWPQTEHSQRASMPTRCTARKSVQQKPRHAGHHHQGQITGAVALCVGRTSAGASPGTDVEGQVYDELRNAPKWVDAHPAFRAVFFFLLCFPCLR